MKKFLSFVLALCMVMAMCVPAFAGTIETSGDDASVPVTLNTTDDGTLGGNPAPAKLSVTLPTTLPLAVSPMGEVVTADNVKITNNSFGAVRVKEVKIDGAGGWTLIAYGNKAALAAEKVDSKKLGFQLTLGEGSPVATQATEGEQTLISAPQTGCYMTGKDDATKNFIDVKYAAMVTPSSTPVTGTTVSNLTFIVEWDTI